MAARGAGRIVENMRSRNAFLVGWAVTGGLALGCSGGQTGDLGGAREDSHAGHCSESETRLAELDTQTALGFSAADVLDWLSGVHTSRLVWGNTSLVEFSPHDSMTDVSFRIECPDPDPRFVASEPKQQASLDAADIDDDSCPDLVRLDCQLQMTTDDGGLDESWAVSIDARRADLASVDHALEPDRFRGSFEIGAPKLDNAEIEQLTLELGLSRFGVRGTLTSILESRSDAAVSATGARYASWPAETCGEPGSQAFALGPSSDAGAVASEAILQQLVPDAARAVDWPAGEQASLNLDVVPDALGCVQFGPHAEGLSVSYAARVEASTQDGRLEFTADGRLEATFDARVELVRAAIRASLVPSLEQVALLLASSEDRAQALADEYAGLELELTQSFDSGTSQGTLRLLGSVVPDCIANPAQPEQDEDTGGGTPGCSGIDQVSLFETHWTP